MWMRISASTSALSDNITLYPTYVRYIRHTHQCASENISAGPSLLNTHCFHVLCLGSVELGTSLIFPALCRRKVPANVLQIPLLNILTNVEKNFRGNFSPPFPPELPKLTIDRPSHSRGFQSLLFDPSSPGDFDRDYRLKA